MSDPYLYLDLLAVVELHHQLRSDTDLSHEEQIAVASAADDRTGEAQSDLAAGRNHIKNLALVGWKQELDMLKLFGANEGNHEQMAAALAEMPGDWGDRDRFDRLAVASDILGRAYKLLDELGVEPEEGWRARTNRIYQLPETSTTSNDGNGGET